MMGAKAPGMRRGSRSALAGILRSSEAPFALAILAAIIASLLPAGLCSAYTPESPEVLALVDKGLKYLEGQSHVEVGGKCLVGLAFHKRGKPKSHPKIQEALDACREDIETESARDYNYGKCLAIIFLCEIDSVGHRDLINKYAELLREHQKPHGGFSYKGTPVGDTSQTQYAALAYWEMLNHGIAPDAESVQRCLNWIMRTRDPSGVWGYHGIDPGNFNLVQQTNKPGVSMAAAGMSAAMILGNCVGLLRAPMEEAPQTLSGGLDERLPSALRRIELQEQKSQPKRAATLPAGSVDRQRLAETLQAGRAWYDKNFTLKVDEFQSYYLYSIERYYSFQEYLDGQKVEDADWYNDGVKFLQSTQQPDGSWSDQTGAECGTAFSVLFLLRSTQKSISVRLGEGTLVGGRGLPRDLSKVKISGGKLVVQQEPTEVDNLLGLLDESDTSSLDELLDNPAALQVTDVGPDQARRLQQVVRSGSAGARLLAVRALSGLRDVDYAPTLIFALTDPDRRVVREARDGLRSVSRNFEGFGPPDNFDDLERGKSVERWKAWYHTVRPDAPPLP